jgi:hypothetical protein
MTYTPVFRFRPIGRFYDDATSWFRADDPWNGGHPADFALEDYRFTIHAGCRVQAIRSVNDEVIRFLPDSLCDLYQAGKVPAEALPRLLKDFEPGQIRSDYEAVARSLIFSSNHFLYRLLCCVVIFAILLGMYAGGAPVLAWIITPPCLVGSLWGLIYLSFQRKLDRRKRQQAGFLAAAQAMG